MGDNLLRSEAEEVLRGGGMEDTRKRGVYLIKVILWATAGGGVILMGSATMVGLNSLIGFLMRMRDAVGVRAIPGQPDYFVLVSIGCLFLAIGGGILAFLLWYRRLWRNKLKKFWNGVDSENRKPFSQSLPFDRGQYIKGLLTTDTWLRWYNEETEKRKKEVAFPKDADPVKLSAEQIDIVAKAIFEKIKADISERAFAVGMVVGISRSPFIDRVTIIAAALELQLHVLTRLGKKPSLKMWRELITRTLSSLFFNTYLSREECSGITISIKTAALGLEGGAGLLEDSIQSVREMDLEYAEFVLLPLNVFSGISKTAAQSLARFIDRAGDDLLEGILAGGILYYHGAMLAAKCLAPDPEKLAECYDLSPTKCVKDGITQAAKIVKDLIRRKREQLKDNKMTLLKPLKNKFSKK